MNDLRTAAQQALEALNSFLSDDLRPYQAAKVYDALKATLAQEQAKPTGKQDLQVEPAQEPPKRKLVPTEPTIGMCIAGDGARQNVDDLTRTPAIYRAMIAAAPASSQQAEPAQQPVAWRTFDGEGGYEYRAYEDNECYAAAWAQRNPRHAGWVEALYTAPPRRTMVPLTEEEIKTAFHAARNAKLGASQDNSRHRLSVIEIARAVEKASWEKNHGQA